jgi:hypothetical protein
MVMDQLQLLLLLQLLLEVMSWPARYGPASGQGHRPASAVADVEADVAVTATQGQGHG